MAQVYFLVPGLIPGPSAKDRISGATIDRLRKTIGRLSDDPVLQPLGSSVFAKSVHLSWMWSVLTRRALPLPPLLMPGLSKTDRCSQETSGP